MLMKGNYLFSILLVAATLSACKKDKNDAQSPAITGVALKDSAVIYSRDFYLWYDQIPAAFDGRNYEDPNDIMEAIRPYSIEAGFSTPVDRWSFAVKQAEWDNISNGISGDFGLSVFFYKTDDLRVKAVESESPAGKAGIRRGWRITKISGNSNLTSSNADFVVQNVFNSTQTNFTFQKPGGALVDIALNATTYTEHPIILDSIYTINSKKIGYLVFNSFLGDTARINKDFQRVFNSFAGEHISDIVVDMRYNGGGYVSIQEKLADYLVPSTANGLLMMKQVFNNKNNNYNTVVNFNKAGALNLPRILFIVSSSTASASELLINNLKPYMTVKLVGPQPTHGKPVGFFAVPVGDWYIFPVSFRTTNKNNEGSYFSGLPLNSVVQDGLDKDWGDVSEPCLSSALVYLTSGSFGVQGDLHPRGANQAELHNSNLILNKKAFRGAIDDRRR